jgi:hypothetical protein
MTNRWFLTIALLQLAVGAHARSFDVKRLWGNTESATHLKRELESLSKPLIARSDKQESVTRARTSKHFWLEDTNEKPRKKWGSSVADKLKPASRVDSGHVKRHFIDVKAVSKKEELGSKKPTGERRNLQLEVSREACMAEAQTLEADPDKGYECSCEANSGNGYSLGCSPTCGEFCNEEGFACGEESLTKIFDLTGAVTQVKDGFEYTRGREGRVLINQLGCAEDDQGNQECSECVVVVNSNRACDSCSMTTCSDGSKAPMMDCGNIEDGASFNLCEGDIDVQEGFFEFLSTNEFEECLDPLVAVMGICEADRQFYETNFLEKEYDCTCEENSLGSVTLGCAAACGEYCNSDNTVCGSEVYDQLYDLTGNPYLVASNFLYSKGSSECLFLIKTGCILCLIRLSLLPFHDDNSQVGSFYSK